MDENGDGAPAVFVVERTIAGLTAERTPTFDYVAHIADLTLHDVAVAADRRLAAVDVAPEWSAPWPRPRSAGRSRRSAPASASST
jgi:hypothetical protein